MLIMNLAILATEKSTPEHFPTSEQKSEIFSAVAKRLRHAPGLYAIIG